MSKQLHPNSALIPLDNYIISPGPFGVAIFATRVHIAYNPRHLSQYFNRSQSVLKILELIPWIIQFVHEANISIIAGIGVQKDHVKILFEDWCLSLGGSRAIGYYAVNEVIDAVITILFEFITRNAIVRDATKSVRCNARVDGCVKGTQLCLGVWSVKVLQVWWV